jgi:dihydroorotate dehydrogenase
VIDALFALARPLASAIDPERAHDLAIAALRTGLAPRQRAADDPRLSVGLLGFDFPNPVGMAAGFDKDGKVPDALLDFGFGFVEIGTVAPRPQPGNPRPRVFRLPAERAVINRYGFNTDGHSAVLARLKKRKPRGIVAINIGANKDSSDRVGDYVAGVTAFAGYAGYLTVNVSSPNTPGLRELQSETALDDLLARVVGARDTEADRLGRRVPLMLKIAPDLADADLDMIAGMLPRHAIDGLVISNTTLDRTGVSGAMAQEAGGLSGWPLFRRSTIVLARMRERVGPGVPIIGVGGIESGATAFEKVRAGANLVQLYTGLVYKGPGLLADIKRDLVARIERAGYAGIGEAVGTASEDWAREPL